MHRRLLALFALCLFASLPVAAQTLPPAPRIF